MRTGFGHAPITTSPTHANSHECYKDGGLRGGASKADLKEGNRTSHWKPQSPIFQYYVRSKQDRRLVEASYQFETPQQVHPAISLQDGINQNSETPYSERRLDGETRFKRCLSIGSTVSPPQKIRRLQMEGPRLAVQGPPIRTEQCPIHLHEVDETSALHPQEYGSQSHSLLGRHVISSEIGRGRQSPDQASNGIVISPRFHNQPSEISDYPSTDDGIPRISTGFTRDEDCPSTSEVEVTEGVSNQVYSENIDISSRAGPDCRDDGCSSSSHSASTTPLQSIGEGEIPSTQEGLPLQPQFGNDAMHESGPGLVDGSGFNPQWSPPGNPELGSSDRDRRFLTGVGSFLPGCSDRWTLDHPGRYSAYQLLGVTGMFPSTQILCGETIPSSECPFEDGQHYSDRLREPNGRISFSLLVRPCCGDMGMVHRARFGNSRGTPSWTRERPGRLGIPPCEGLERLATQQGGVSPVGGPFGPLFHRPVCFPYELPVTHVLQLAPRPISTCSGCPVYLLDQSPRIYVSTLCPHSEVSREVTSGSSNSSNDRTSLAQPALVPSPVTCPSRIPGPSSVHQRHSHGTTQQHPSLSGPGTTTSGRLASFRVSQCPPDLSERVLELISKSWRKSTEATYSSAWRLWSNWCTQRRLDPLSAPLREVLEFLCEEFEAGKQYRTINTLRSAISMTHTEVDGARVGQHTLVTRLLKGVYNSRPPAPRYSSTWDVSVVLEFIKSLPDNNQLSLPDLTHKLAMLLALTNAARCSELSQLSLDHKIVCPDGVRFTIIGLTKTRKRGPAVEVFYPTFEENTKLCPVRTLAEYECRTRNVRTRSNQGSRPLFISVRRPFRPVKPCTIGRWLRTIMQKAGVDTSIFSAHSTRGASSSKARAAGVSVADILRTASWASESTFCRFYYRPA